MVFKSKLVDQLHLTIVNMEEERYVSYLISGAKEVIDVALSKYILLGVLSEKKNPVKGGSIERLLFVDQTKK
jgi:hypothetical protein